MSPRRQKATKTLHNPSFRPSTSCCLNLHRDFGFAWTMELAAPNLQVNHEVGLEADDDQPGPWPVEKLQVCK